MTPAKRNRPNESYICGKVLPFALTVLPTIGGSLSKMLFAPTRKLYLSVRRAVRARSKKLCAGIFASCGKLCGPFGERFRSASLLVVSFLTLP